MAKFFPKKLFVTINGAKGDKWFSANKNEEDAFDGSDSEGGPVDVAVYELKSLGKVKRTITTDWEG